MKEKDVKKKNFLYAIMHAIFDLLYKLPSACHFRQLSVSSFDLLCTRQSTKAKFEPKISAFHYFLFSSSQVFVKQTYNTTKGHYKFIEKSCLFIHMWQSHTKHYFMVHAMFGNELFLYIKSIPINGLLVFSSHLLAQIRPCQMIIQSVLSYCLQPCAILSASLLVSSRLWRKFTWHENQHIFVSTQHRYTKRQKHTSPPATKTCCNSAIIVTEKSSINHHTYIQGNTSYYPQFS